MKIDERLTLRNERIKLRLLVMEIYERREYADCWYNSAGADINSDCGNWPDCKEECPLRRLAAMAGIEPRVDGRIV